MKAETLHRPLSLDKVRDGGVYKLNLPALPQTSHFFKVGCLDEVFVKLPSPLGIEDYRRYLKQAQSASADIRTLDECERFEHLDAALARFPEFRQLSGVSAELLHYLTVHRIQYERLRSESAVAIPSARFALWRSGIVLSKPQPIFFQERVEGTTLWDIFDFDRLQIRERWLPHVHAISAQLTKILESPLVSHIDWNIQNFVFREADERLFYVDLKPTSFVAARGNEHNLKGIRDYFVR